MQSSIVGQTYTEEGWSWMDVNLPRGNLVRGKVAYQAGPNPNTCRAKSCSTIVWALPRGAKVGNSSLIPCQKYSCNMAYANSHGIYGGPWWNVSNRYVGLKFDIRGKPHFGWARLSVARGGATATLTGYAYETIPNKPIIAGKTKGPDVVTMPPDTTQPTLGRLALGRK